MTTLFKIIDRIRKIQDDDIDQVLQRYPIKTPNYPHTKTFNVFMEDAEDAARLKVDQAGEIDDLANKHEREKEALKTRHERENERQKDNDDTEKEREANQSSRETNEAFSKKQARGKDIAKKMMKSKTMGAFAKKVAKIHKISAFDLNKMLPDYVSGGDIGALFETNLQEEMIDDFEIRFGKESDWKKADKLVQAYLRIHAPKHAIKLFKKDYVHGPDPLMVAFGDTKKKLKPPVNLNKLYNSIRKLPSSRDKYWDSIPKNKEKDAIGYGESFSEGKKTFRQTDNVGKAKYTISYHDGKKKHKDGSDFFDMEIFKNKPSLEKFKKDLLKKGYKAESIQESFSRSLVNKAIKLIKSPKYFQGNYTGAVKAIEKLKKGLSDDSRVLAALRTANEHHKKKGMHTHSEGVDGDAMIDLMQKYLNTKNKGEKKTLLKQINRYQKKLGLKVTEELDANATVGDYISDFSKSDAPQFKGKSAKKVRSMAIAAFNANK